MGARVREVARERSWGVDGVGRRPTLVEGASAVGRRDPTGEGLDLDDAELVANRRRGRGNESPSSSDVDPPDVWKSVLLHADEYSLSDLGSTGGGGTTFFPPNTEARRLMGVVNEDRLESTEGRRGTIDSTLLLLGSLACPLTLLFPLTGEGSVTIFEGTLILDDGRAHGSSGGSSGSV